MQDEKLKELLDSLSRRVDSLGEEHVRFENEIASLRADVDKLLEWMRTPPTQRDPIEGGSPELGNRPLCPHGRAAMQSCPHCLGLNQPSAPVEAAKAPGEAEAIDTFTTIFGEPTISKHIAEAADGRLAQLGYRDPEKQKPDAAAGEQGCTLPHIGRWTAPHRVNECYGFANLEPPAPKPRREHDPDCPSLCSGSVAEDMMLGVSGPCYHNFYTPVVGGAAVKDHRCTCDPTAPPKPRREHRYEKAWPLPHMGDWEPCDNLVTSHDDFVTYEHRDALAAALNAPPAPRTEGVMMHKDHSQYWYTWRECVLEGDCKAAEHRLFYQAQEMK
jgi:hypothetical protein